jgi:hypothetical protein
MKLGSQAAFQLGTLKLTTRRGEPPKEKHKIYSIKGLASSFERI